MYKLFEHQRAGVRWLRDRRRAVLADDMGLGKTAQILNALGDLPAVVLCPASVRSVWADEVRLWRPDLSCEVVTHGGQVVEHADVSVVSYDLFTRGLKTKLRKPGTLVCDEAHYLQSRKSKRTKTVTASADPVTHGGLRVWLATGTPVWSRPRSLFPLLNIVCRADMKAYADYYRYAVRFCDGRKRYQPGAGYVFDDSGASNLDELRDMFAPHVLRRLKGEVLGLPEKTRQLIRLDTPLSAAERELGPALDIDGGGLGSNGLPPGPIATAVKDTALLKLPACVEHIRGVLEQEHKAVVFAWNLEVLDGLAAGLNGIKCVRIDGSTKHTARAAAVEDFQRGDARVFLGQTAAAGTGITLTAARVVVFVQPDWTPANLLQAEDRVHRIGQRGTVTIQYLTTSGSIEEYMLGVAGEKLGISRTLLGD